MESESDGMLAIYQFTCVTVTADRTMRAGAARQDEAETEGASYPLGVRASSLREVSQPPLRAPRRAGT